MKKTNSLDLIVKNNACVGCGSCANKKINIKLNKFGLYQPIVNEDSIDSFNSKICPFSDNSLNEDAISKKYYSKNEFKDDFIGYYKKLYVGHVRNDKIRSVTTSGGIITWLLNELVKKKKIDFVIHVKSAKSNKEKILFEYAISTNYEEILEGAKSRYYPIEISKILEIIRSKEGRYVFVGLPCFVKAIRLHMNNDTILKNRIKFCVGLVCGHLKSTEFSKFFGWQVGIKPTNLETIDFRAKLRNYDAGNYGVNLVGEGKNVTKNANSFFGSNWTYNFFRNPACNYCDDVFAETADIVVGDAWLEKYVEDDKGNSIILIRNNELIDLFKNGIASNDLNLSLASKDELIKSQSGGIRDRREGLAYRLFLNSKSKKWSPKKRVKPSNNLDKKRKKIYELRILSEKLTHKVWYEAKIKNSYSFFEKNMREVVESIDGIYKKSFFNRITSLFLRMLTEPILTITRAKLKIKRYRKKI